MKTLIVYMSRHGCAAKSAGILSGLLSGDVTAVDLGKERPPSPAGFDAVVVGGSIHAGQLQRKMKKYCLRNLDILLDRRLGLYVCCMEEGEKAREQFDRAFPVELRSHASAIGLFGGEFDLARMNFFERKMIQKAADITESVSKIDEESIRRFAEEMEASHRS